MQTIYKGRLNNGDDFHVRPLTIKDISKIFRLQSDVYKKITNKAQLAQLTKDEFEYILTGKGLMLGVFVENELIAIRALLVPKIDDPEHLGLDVGLSKEQLAEVIYQEISFVHLDYQGNRLQQTLAKLIMEQLEKENHKYRYVCCTVAPFNLPSLIDKFKQGMYVKALTLKYADQLRYVFLKDLQAPLPIESVKEKRDVPMELIEQQQQLLANGWVGMSLKRNDNSYVVTYVKF